MSLALQILLSLAAVITVSEGANKLERLNPLEKGQTTKGKIANWLKATAWFFISLGAGIYLLAVPFGNASEALTHLAAPLVLIGFAVLILKTRVKEG